MAARLARDVYAPGLCYGKGAEAEDLVMGEFVMNRDGRVWYCRRCKARLRSPVA